MPRGKELIVKERDDDETKAWPQPEDGEMACALESLFVPKISGFAFFKIVVSAHEIC